MEVTRVQADPLTPTDGQGKVTGAKLGAGGQHGSQAGPLGPWAPGCSRQGASCLGRNQRGWAGRMGLLQRTGLGSGMDLSKKTTSLVTTGLRPGRR